MASYEQLSAFCVLANKMIRNHYGRPDSCIYSAGVVCDVLTHFGIRAEPLRVEAAIFPNIRQHGGVVLGSLGDGTRRPAAKPDCWHGHLCTLVENVYLVDTTFDQVNVGRPELKAGPVTLDLRETKWFDPSPPWRGCPWTGCLSIFDSTVRYTRYPRQVGFKSAGDFQPSRRRRLVPELIALAKPLFSVQEVF
jgi:hypothetical protein